MLIVHIAIVLQTASLVAAMMDFMSPTRNVSWVNPKTNNEYFNFTYYTTTDSKGHAVLNGHLQGKVNHGFEYGHWDFRVCFSFSKEKDFFVKRPDHFQFIGRAEKEKFEVVRIVRDQYANLDDMRKIVKLTRFDTELLSNETQEFGINVTSHAFNRRTEIF